MANNSRAGGNGTAGTAMAVPAFEGEKWRRLDFNLNCVIKECHYVPRSRREPPCIILTRNTRVGIHEYCCPVHASESVVFGLSQWRRLK